MNREQAIEAIRQNNGQPVKVRHIKNGTVYWIERDVVMSWDEGMLYGWLDAPKPGERVGYRFFDYKSVELVNS